MSSPARVSRGSTKRDEILAVALDAFATHGYDRTSVRHIARRAGLSQAGLLHYFRTKEDLFVEVLRRRDETNESRYHGDTGERLTVDGLVSTVQHNATEPGLVRLYVAMSAESTATGSPAREFFDQRYRDLRHGLADDLRRQQREGSIEPSLDADGVATLLVAAADGLQIQWLLDSSGVDMGAKLAQFFELLRPGGSHIPPPVRSAAPSSTD